MNLAKINQESTDSLIWCLREQVRLRDKGIANLVSQLKAAQSRLAELGVVVDIDVPEKYR